MSRLEDLIVNSIIGHYGAILSGIVLFLVVAAHRMPIPGKKWTRLEMYRWFYDTVQTILPISRIEAPSTSLISTTVSNQNTTISTNTEEKSV